MSVLDKWLNKCSQNGELATSATSATNPNVACYLNDLSVATDLRQGRDKPGQNPDVAILSQPICDRNCNENQVVAANVADVANVATSAPPEFWPTSTVINFSDRPTIICILCRGNITCPTHWWGGEPCHRACGEVAFREAKDRGDYRRDDSRTP